MARARAAALPLEGGRASTVCTDPMVALATLLAAGAGILVVALQIAARLSQYLAPGAPATVGYATSNCQSLAFSLWFPIQPRPALPYFSYLQAQSARPTPPWVVPGRVGRILAALTLALDPYIFRSTVVGSTSIAHWRRRRKSCSGRGGKLNHPVSIGSGGLVIMIQGFEAFTFIAAELCEALASRGFAVAAIDLAQHERVEARLAAVTALLGHILSEHSEHLDPDRVVVVGHSRGGSQAAHLALSDPRVRGAILLHSNAGDMHTLMRAQPVPSASCVRAPTALLVVHALDDRAVRAHNHSAWANILDEHTQSRDTWRWHALVDAPCGHDGCTSLHTLLSFAMPRWIFETLSHLSHRISALRTLCPVGVTEPRARQLVAITSRYVCDFAEDVLASNETGQPRGCAQASPAPARDSNNSGAGVHSMGLFDGTAHWLHEVGFWRLRTTSADSNGGMHGEDDRGGKRFGVQPHRPAQAQVQMEDAGVVQQLHASTLSQSPS